jgi:hypothetical protein
MSSIRYKLRKLLPIFKTDAALIKDRDILKKWRVLKFIIESPKSIVNACRHREVSTDFFYKWSNLLLKGKSLSALAEKSRTPINQPNKTTS